MQTTYYLAVINQLAFLKISSLSLKVVLSILSNFSFKYLVAADLV